ncbi:DNA-(apurinic or apyrimidinic site) endonuclease [Trifolium repens]|nr:DNA-(apurinic or apyrimidinic site) endonuclease [Trifolium repens]
MKIVSWNIRGLGRVDKRNEVRKLVREKHPLVVCVQETKVQTCDDFLCTTVWGSSPSAFSFRPSVGASGGLLTIWDTTEVEMWSTLSRDHVLWDNGRIIKTGEEFWVANVYAPCDPGAKQRLWDSLFAQLQVVSGSRVCVCGDFNAVRRVDERRSTGNGHRSSDHIAFNRFVEENLLVDLPLCGRKFT